MIEQKITNEAAKYIKMNIQLAEYPYEIKPETIKKWAKKDFTEGAKWMNEQYQSNPSEFGMVKPEEGMMAVQVSIAHPSATLLQVALMMCNEEQLISLRDALIERTPALVRVKQSEDRLKLYEQSFSEWKLESEKTIKEKDAQVNQLVEALREIRDKVNYCNTNSDNDILDCIDVVMELSQTALTNYEQGKGNDYCCESGTHDVIPTLGYENSVTGEECRVCGKKL